ncbi:hypothetical protein AC1031_013788 [Aphanomyces cochlioides]|nr:hypothetical protein AC1031_013788 [Aphanomyces cochlioides]
MDPMEDRGRRQNVPPVKRLFRSPQGRRQPVADDETWESKPARYPFGTPGDRLPDGADDTYEDVDMGQGDGFMLNTPPLPKNPTFKGSTANGVRPFIMPVNTCIEPATKQRVAEWAMGKEPDEVTEGEWIAWFKLAYDVDPRALKTLKNRIAVAVVFDMLITDADSRIGRMLDNMSAALRRDRQEWILRKEGAAVVKIITDTIKPAAL